MAKKKRSSTKPSVGRSGGGSVASSRADVRRKKSAKKKVTKKKSAKKETTKASVKKKAAKKTRATKKQNAAQAKASRFRSRAEATESVWITSMRKANPELIEFEGWEQDREQGELPELDELDLHTQGVEVHDDWFKARDAVCKSLGGSEMRRKAILSFESSLDHMGLANIQGIGVGMKECCGHITGDLCVKIFVREKLPKGKIDRSAQIPESIQGLATDVEPIQEFHASVFTLRDRPQARCGVSISHPSVGAGSMAALVQLNNGKLAILSNNHVLANENNAVVGQSRILQPGFRDGGNFKTDGIGLLEKFIPLKFGQKNALDAAVAHTSFSLVSPQHFNYMLNPRPVAARKMMFVIKNGRTTQGTGGWISTIGANDMTVNYRSGIAFFDNQIVIKGLSNQAFSLNGDSGALVVSAGTKQPVGLLFAGSPTQSLATPIATVMQQLGIRRFIAPQ